MSAFSDAIRKQLEAAKASNVDAFISLDYAPTSKQSIFHAATEFDVLFGGAAGGGKSKALLMQGIKWCQEYAGIRGAAFRRTYPELEKSLLVELQKLAYCKTLGAKWHGGRRDLTFPNGSVMTFGYLDSFEDATKYQGGEFQFFLFDELTLFRPEAVAFLYSRLRSGHADIPVLGVRSSSNPGGAGHGAVKAKFIDATNYGENIVTDSDGNQVRFIPSKVADNPHIDSGYVKRLAKLPDAMRKAFLDGSWDAFAGQYFTEWSQDRHVVPPFDLDPSWKRVCGIDWGYAAPWAVVWVAVDEDGRVFVYDELYATLVGEAEQARRILAAEEAHQSPVMRFADDAMWTKRGDAKSIAKVYAENGCRIRKARKGERLPGWQRVRSFLADGPACRFHRAMGWDTCPMLHVLAGTAPNLVRTLPNLPFDATKVEDIDTHAEDHSADALRYALLQLGRKRVVDGFLSDASEPEIELPPRIPSMPVEDYDDFTLNDHWQEDTPWAL